MESIAHTALLAHPYPLSSLIAGGSQKDPEVQTILTEVFRHETVRRVAVIESLQDKNTHVVEEHLSHPYSATTTETVDIFPSLECLQLLLKNKPKTHNFPQNSPFDVIILLHPFMLFSDASSRQYLNKHEYKMEFSNFTQSIFNY